MPRTIAHQLLDLLDLRSPVTASPDGVTPRSTVVHIGNTLGVITGNAIGPDGWRVYTFRDGSAIAFSPSGEWWRIVATSA